ncbi:MAG: phosphatase PAP2 family protein [Eubacteriales bacterium]
MTKPVKPVTTGKTQNAAVEAVKDKTSSPAARRRKTRLFQLSVGIMLAAFAVLTFLVITVPSFAIDLSIAIGLQSINNPVFSGLMTLISWAGFSPQSFIASAVIIVILFVLGYRWESVAALVISVIVPLLNFLIKTLVHRTRPGVDLIHVVRVLNDYSFPSGHVMFYTGFFGFVCFLTYTLLKPSWIRTLLLIVFVSHILLVGISRIYLGQHWASDVLGAYLLGGLCLIAGIRFYRWGKTRFFIHQPCCGRE